jgi:thiamine-phosphate pyrophosphorylase
MQIVVISPESADSRELPAMEAFFAAGLERYHVRKPAWSREALEAWLEHIPVDWRPRIFLHQHHPLMAKLGLGGIHDSDGEAIPGLLGSSRSCHHIEAIRLLMPLYPMLFFGPVFPSLSKSGYGPAADFPWDDLRAILRKRTPADARVVAIGGVTAPGLARCSELGFDGAAVLGAVWNERDPVAAFAGIREAAARLEAASNAA